MQVKVVNGLSWHSDACMYDIYTETSSIYDVYVFVHCTPWRPRWQKFTGTSRATLRKRVLGFSHTTNSPCILIGLRQYRNRKHAHAINIPSFLAYYDSIVFSSFWQLKHRRVNRTCRRRGRRPSATNPRQTTHQDIV